LAPQVGVSPRCAPTERDRPECRILDHTDIGKHRQHAGPTSYCPSRYIIER
jgi:hypothetical protein